MAVTTWIPPTAFGGGEAQSTATPGQAGETARWNNHVFKVEPKAIRGFTGLQIKGGSETEDKVGGSQKFVSRKNSKPAEITLTAVLSAQLGCKVKREAMQFVSEAYEGASDWFYLGTSKLATYKLMLTEATVKDVTLTPGGKWLSAHVALTLKQCTQKNGSTAGVVEKSDGDESDGGGGGGGSGGGGKKRSVRGGGKKTPSKFADSGSQRHASRGTRDRQRETATTAQDEVAKRKRQATEARRGLSGGGSGKGVQGMQTR